MAAGLRPSFWCATRNRICRQAYRFVWTLATARGWRNTITFTNLGNAPQPRVGSDPVVVGMMRLEVRDGAGQVAQAVAVTAEPVNRGEPLAGRRSSVGRLQ